MKKKNSLQIRAIFIISLIFITLISLVTTIEYVSSKKLILSSMESPGKQTVTIHAQNLSSWVESRLSQVEVIANMQLVYSMNYSQIMPYFEREQKNYGGVFNRLFKISLIADEVAKGKLLSYLPESSDELGRINTTFNKMINNLKNIIIEIKNVSGVVVKSSNSYKNVSLEVVKGGENTKKSIEDLTLCAKKTMEEIQNITVSVNDMENKSKELVEISTNIDMMIAEAKDKTLNGSINSDATQEISYQI